MKPRFVVKAGSRRLLVVAAVVTLVPTFAPGALAAQSERVSNGSFEAGDEPWSYNASQRCAGTTCGFSAAHGDYYGTLGSPFGYTAPADSGANLVGWVRQTIDLPAGPAVLSLELRRVDFGEPTPDTEIAIWWSGTRIHLDDDQTADSWQTLSVPIPGELTGDGPGALEFVSYCFNFDFHAHNCDRYDIDDVSVLAGTDTEPPQTRLAKLPGKVRLQEGARRAILRARFSSSEPDSTFRCKLDAGPYRSCTSPRALRLDPGRHRFRVVATDPAGNPDPSPAEATTRVLSA